MSFDRLQEKIDKMKNPTVVGLDPDIESIPARILEKHIGEKGETLEAAAAAALEFNMGLIDALCDVAPAVKPQSAFHEAFGPAGVAALKKTIDYAKSKGMYVICDGKRNDIGSTVGAYSAAYLGAIKVGGTELRPFDADALTVNAYLGSDGLRSFIETAVKYDKAIYVLVKTSNESAGELQDMLIFKSASERAGESASERASKRTAERTGEGTAERGGEGTAERTAERTLYAAVGDLTEELSRGTIGKYGYTRAGAVVGATYPEEIAFMRARLKHTFFLVPGYGAQGGAAADVARAFDEKGRGAIVNSSRAIIAAWKKTGGDYQVAARAEALKMRDELTLVLSNN